MEKILSYKGEKVYYKDSGKGEPVMLIHGFAEDGTLWDRQTNALEKKFRILIPDIPGSHLASTGQTRLSSIEQYAACMKAVLDEEQIKKCILIGHSMGGYITLAFAEKYPDYLNGMGLFHSTAYADSEEKKTARRKSIEMIRQYGSSAFLEQAIPNLFSDHYKKQNPKEVASLINRYANFKAETLVSYYEAMIKRPDRTHILKAYPKPVLFIIGECDKAVPLEHSLEQCHMPQLSYIHVLENTAHMGMLENTDLTNHMVENFLSQVLF
jgi:pimeloyl-ACP methyl ester carboxylesterase